MSDPRYVVRRLSGEPVAENDELTVDSNYPVTLVRAVDATRISIRWGWGAVEEIKASRAAVVVDRV
ncbi:hypothetical protein ACFU6S_32710 [Streptomyces sp. NPDC057456]|uniref:hypothetical protein n=1 Tax=Streptomyces sp. NPDC057456 TaxID=3346139 RepID=UPI003676FD80